MAKEQFFIREFDTNKWYWCKCANCGWEDSSEFAAGGGAIADTGDFFDPICPICHSNNIDAESSLSIPESYSGMHKVKIPIDSIKSAYEKALKQLMDEYDSLKYPSPQSEPAAQPAKEGGEADEKAKEEYPIESESDVIAPLLQRAFVEGAKWQLNQSR